MSHTLSKFFAALLLFTAACAPVGTPASESTPIVFQLGSTHQALYAGFYTAEQEGYYAREGLDVSFIEGGTNLDIVTPLLNGTAQFGIMGATSLINERANGQPVRAIATILRRDPVVFFSLAESGIVRLEDFVGKKVQVSARVLPRLYAMLAHANISDTEVEVITTAPATALYSGDIDVASGLYTTAALAAQRDGHAINIIYPDDYGVHFYSTTIFTTDDYIAENSEVVTRFLRATLQGWDQIIENPETAGELVLSYNPNADSAFESASMVASVPYINTGEDFIGWMSPAIWEGMADSMRAQFELTAPLDVSDVYTMDFIQQIYGEPIS